MMNELFAGLSDKYLVAKLDGFAGFASFEQFGVFLEQTVDLFVGGDDYTVKNPLFGLVDDSL